MADILQWVLPVLGLTGTYIVGKKNVWGWLLQLAGQVLWAWFIIAIDKPGLLIGTLSYAAVYGWNFGKWLKEERDKRRHAEAGAPAGEPLHPSVGG